MKSEVEEDDGNMVETVNQQKLYQQDFVACDDTVTKLKRVIFAKSILTA